MTFGEDASRVRTGHGLAMMAVLRNLEVSVARTTGATNIAAWTRANSHDYARATAISNSG